MRRLLALIFLGSLLTACATIPVPPADPEPVAETETPPTQAQPLPEPPAAPRVQTPPPAPVEPPPDPVIEAPAPSEFAGLPFWASHNPTPALSAFVRGCETWSNAEDTSYLNPNLPQYGTYGDWRLTCQSAAVLQSVSPGAEDVRRFFEGWFKPVSLATPADVDGLLTGYYEPEVEVRLSPSREFSEPILAKPKDPAKLNLPRAQVNASTSRVIAYGRPIDVFFLQVQGSGRLKYSDGRILRAAYAGNNGKTYRSIGGVLIDRGELTRETASKQSIAEWMDRKGPQAARDLMNENPRYIYFTEQSIRGDEGPQGAMRVPLTAMGAIAVDPRYHPYGSLVWLETTLPTKPGDYRGQPTGLLVTAQDTGNAIKGPLRGDLFFGSGKEAGDRAGVQKHRAKWTIFLPRFISDPLLS